MFDMRGLLIISHVVFFILLYFVPSVITRTDCPWVPKQVASLGRQCVRRGYRGSCNLCSVYGYTHRRNVGICKQLLCANSVGPEYVGTPVGPADIGSPCDVHKVCDDEQECVKVPKHKWPLLVGSNPYFTCVQRSTFDGQ